MMVYALMIPFLFSAAGGCQVIARVVEFRISSSKLSGGAEGATGRNHNSIVQFTHALSHFSLG